MVCPQVCWATFPSTRWQTLSCVPQRHLSTDPRQWKEGQCLEDICCCSVASPHWCLLGMDFWGSTAHLSCSPRGMDPHLDPDAAWSTLKHWSFLSLAVSLSFSAVTIGCVLPPLRCLHVGLQCPPFVGSKGKKYPQGRDTQSRIAGSLAISSFSLFYYTVLEEYIFLGEEAG